MSNANELLTENIDDWKELKEVQLQVTHAQFGARAGLFAIEFSVAAEMAKLGVAALPTGTYYIPAPQKEANANVHAFDNFFIPAGTLTKSMWVHTHEAKAGSGTITPFIGAAGATDLTAISTAGHNDDTSNLVAGDIIVTDADVGVVIASNTVTAGAFTIFLEYYIGNVG